MMEDDECPYCGGDGYIMGDCTCGDDCCCCLEPEPPECWHCAAAPKPDETVCKDEV